MDFAQLGIKIDSSQAKTATADLDKLAAVGERAQKSIAATENAAKKMAKGFDDGQKAVAKANDSIEKYVRGLQLAAATNGKSARETQLLVLATQGATRAQLQAADAAIRMNEGYARGVEIGRQLRLGFIALAASAATAATATIASNIKMLDGLDDLSEKSGVAVETLSGLKFAGEAAGTSFGSLTTGLTRLSKVMAEAAGGNKEAKATFAALGVEVTDTNGKLRGSDEVLLDLANRFSGYEDGAGKAALAQRVFGRSGEELIPLLNQGAAGIERLRKEAQQLGAIYSGDVARSAADFNDNLAKIKLASEGAAISISSGLIKSLAQLSTEFLEAKKNGGLFAAGMESYFSGVKAFWNGTLFSGQAAMKSTEQIQAYVNKLGGAAAGGGRGFRNPLQPAPLVLEEEKKKRPRAPRADHSAEQEAKAQLALDIDAIRNAQDAVTNTISNAEKVLEAKRAAILVDEKAYYDAKRALLVASNTAQEEGARKEIARLEAEKLSGKDAIDNQRKIADAQAKLNKLRENGATALEVLSLQEKGAMKRIEDAFGNAQDAAKSYLDTIARGFDREIAGFGQGNKARDNLNAIGSIDDRRQQAEEQLRGELRRGEITKAEFDRYLKVAKDTHAKEIALYERRTQTLEAMQKDWINGATEALRNYSDEAGNIAKNTEEAFTNAFRGLEAQLTNLFTGKKFDAKSLLSSIGTDLARNAVKENITGPLAKALGDTLKGGGGNFLTDTIGALLGGGKGASGSPGAAAGSASAAAASTAALATSAAGATTAIASLATAAASAATALSGSSIGGLGGLFSGGGGAGAGGGDDSLGALIAMNGWSEGGYTGPGSKYQPAGIVHAGEYVVNAENTRRLGVSFLERLNRRGYADGGFVGSIMGGGDTSNVSSSSTTVNIANHFAAGTDSRTVDQAAVKMARALERSQRDR